MRVGILTSGGDAPGMNAAVRAVARTAFFRGWDVMGIRASYRGLLEGRIYPMDRRRLGGIIHRGGTVLGTERSAEFATPEGQRKAAGKLDEAGHIQRGGVPTASDRILASRLGSAAVEALADGESGVMIGIRGPRIERVPLDEVVGKEQPLDPDLYRMAEVLAGLPE